MRKNISMKVHIKGGLGNQLFQFSFLHFLHETVHSKIGIVKDFNPRADRPFLLEDLIDSCNHVAAAPSKSFFDLAFMSRVKKFRVIRGVIYRLQKSNLVVEQNEYIYSTEISRKRRNPIFEGYFQNWKYVEYVWEKLGPEIWTILDRQVSLKHSTSDYIVIHVRRGDWLLQKEQVGVLNGNYYDNAFQIVLENLNLSWVSIYIITDDVIEAGHLFSKYPNSKILGPSEMDEWTCLKLMSDARAVITANSTLSWWGAFLCQKKGGTIVIPDPWFAGWGERVGSAFALPGALQVDSRYRE